MKKIILLLLIISSINGLAQFPATQSQGTVNTKVVSNGGFQAMKGIINGVFADTTAANADYIDFYNGAQIWTRSDRNFWLRDSVLNTWIRMAKFGDINSSNTDSLFGELDNFLATNRAVNMNGKSFRWTDAADFINYLEYKIQDDGYLEYQLQNVSGTRQTFSTSQPGYINIYTLNTSDGSNPYFYLNSSSDPGTAGFGSILSSGRRADILANYDSVKINLGDSGRLNISALRTAPSTAGMKVMLHGNGGGVYEIDKDSIGSGSLVFQESVVKTNDSVYLEGEKTYPPSTNSVYGRDSLNNAGFFKTIRVDLSNAIQHSLFRYDTTGTFVDGFGFMEAIPDTSLGISAGDTTKYLNFTTGQTLYAPEVGDSVVVNSNFVDKIFTIVREEQTLHYSSISGYTVSGDALTFHPPLSVNERVSIQLKDSTFGVQLSLEEPTESPIDVDFNAIFGSVNESPANQWNYVSGDYAADTLTLLPANGFFQFQIPSDGIVVGLDDNPTNSYYFVTGTVVWSYAFYVFSGTMYIVVDGQAQASPTSIGPVGSYTHIRMRRAGTTIYIQASVGGTSYSTVYTYSPSSTGNLYIKTHELLTSGSLINPKTYGFE